MAGSRPLQTAPGRCGYFHFMLGEGEERTLDFEDVGWMSVPAKVMLASSIPTARHRQQAAAGECANLAECGGPSDGVRITSSPLLSGWSSLLPASYSSQKQSPVFYASAGCQAARRSGKKAALPPPPPSCPCTHIALRRKGGDLKSPLQTFFFCKLLKLQTSLQIQSALPHQNIR